MSGVQKVVLVVGLLATVVAILGAPVETYMAGHYGAMPDVRTDTAATAIELIKRLAVVWVPTGILYHVCKPTIKEK